MDKLMRDMEPETAERIIAGTIAYYRGCSDEVIARQAWIALKSHHRNKHSVSKRAELESITNNSDNSVWLAGEEIKPGETRHYPTKP